MFYGIRTLLGLLRSNSFRKHPPLPCIVGKDKELPTHRKIWTMTLTNAGVLTQWQSQFTFERIANSDIFKILLAGSTFGYVNSFLTARKIPLLNKNGTVIVDWPSKWNYSPTEYKETKEGRIELMPEGERKVFTEGKEYCAVFSDVYFPGIHGVVTSGKILGYIEASLIR